MDGFQFPGFIFRSVFRLTAVVSLQAFFEILRKTYVGLGWMVDWSDDVDIHSDESLESAAAEASAFAIAMVNANGEQPSSRLRLAKPAVASAKVGGGYRGLYHKVWITIKKQMINHLRKWAKKFWTLKHVIWSVMK